MTQNEANGYSKGYAAGKRRIVREVSSALYEYRRDEFKRAVFLVILPQLVAQPWTTGDKAWKGMDEFISGAWKFADLSARGTDFSGEVFTPPPPPESK